MNTEMKLKWWRHQRRGLRRKPGELNFRKMAEAKFDVYWGEPDSTTGREEGMEGKERW